VKFLIDFFYNSAEDQKEDEMKSYLDINELKLIAETAVADGDDTLKKANNTYQLLQSFQSEVQKSSEGAKIALEDVPSIKEKIAETEEIILQAEVVSYFSQN
jgi:hypothetical protein